MITLLLQDRDGSDDQDMASDLRLPGGRPGEAGHPFPHLAHLGHLPGLPALEALNKQQKELLGSASIILPTSSPQGLLKAHSNLFPSPSPHHAPGAGGFPPLPLRPPPQVRLATGLRWPLMCQNINFNLKLLIVLQPTPSSQSNSPSDFGTQQNWSFEEQFKQVRPSSNRGRKVHFYLVHCKFYTGWD